MMKRPFAVTLLAILAAIAGILAIVDVLQYLGWLFSPLNFFGGSIFGAILAGIVALIWFWAAQKLWTLDPQGWLFTVSIAAIYLIFDVIAIITGTPYQFLLAGMIASALALILCILPGTKQAFGQ
jgi:hypothetical protein